ncbi:MAG: peroxiredoxin family protein [bacterium]
MKRNYLIQFLLLLGLPLAALANEPEKLEGLYAPEFSLSGTDGTTHRLAQMLKSGPVAVAWFPKAYTGNCERMLRSLGRIQPELEKSGIKLVAASGDKLKYLKPYAESISLPFPILADPTRTTAVSWSVVGDGRELPRRWIFLIDRDGKIAAVLSDFTAEEAGSAVLNQVKILGWSR